MSLSARLKRPLYDLYLRKLRLEMRSWRIPRHIGIVLDGNRRYARGLGALSVLKGHERGANKLDEVLTWCQRAGVHAVSVWVFSLDNFNRDPEEVNGLMSLFERKFLDLVTNPRVHSDQIRVRSFGRLELLPEAVRDAIREAERATEHYTHRMLNVGIAYGGREEILDAFSRYLEDGEARGRSFADLRRELSAETLAQHLYTSHVPDPDLIIRTSGEVRLSGFMLWQSAYSEFYFCDTYWPAFREIDFLRALRAYHSRQRRYGR
ncbi:MAG TPA: polyprenyl diphosphate synthase [Anaeromyxobacteraceae bacterium]|nr:polyprenyl diphosphate synthase [Anaeromyxobacteraceae bacterium]